MAARRDRAAVAGREVHVPDMPESLLVEPGRSAREFLDPVPEAGWVAAADHGVGGEDERPALRWLPWGSPDVDAAPGPPGAFRAVAGGAEGCPGWCGMGADQRCERLRAGQAGAFRPAQDEQPGGGHEVREVAGAVARAAGLAVQPLADSLLKADQPLQLFRREAGRNRAGKLLPGAG